MSLNTLHVGYGNTPDKIVQLIVSAETTWDAIIRESSERSDESVIASLRTVYHRRIGALAQRIRDTQILGDPLCDLEGSLDSLIEYHNTYTGRYSTAEFLSVVREIVIYYR